MAEVGTKGETGGGGLHMCRGGTEVIELPGKRPRWRPKRRQILNEDMTRMKQGETGAVRALTRTIWYRYFYSEVKHPSPGSWSSLLCGDVTKLPVSPRGRRRPRPPAPEMLPMNDVMA